MKRLPPSGWRAHRVPSQSMTMYGLAQRRHDSCSWLTESAGRPWAFTSTRPRCQDHDYRRRPTQAQRHSARVRPATWRLLDTAQLARRTCVLMAAQLMDVNLVGPALDRRVDVDLGLHGELFPMPVAGHADTLAYVPLPPRAAYRVCLDTPRSRATFALGTSASTRSRACAICSDVSFGDRS